MKKFLLITLVLLVFAGFVFALDYSFEWVSLDGPLYKETIADPYGFTTKFYVQKALGTDRPNKIRTSVVVKDPTSGTEEYVDTLYVDLPYNNDVLKDIKTFSTFLQLRTGLAVSVCRFTFEKVSFDFELGGALNTLFNVFSSSTCLGFDGSWFLGPTVKLNNGIVIRIGFHHFSGHYGDETFDQLYNTNKIDFGNNGLIQADISDYVENYNSNYNYYLKYLIEYVRDNSYILGVQTEPVKNLIFYGELECPKHFVWIRPFADCPSSSTTRDKFVLLECLGKKEGLSNEQVETEKALKSKGLYLALRAHIGAEYSIPIADNGAVILSADLQLHQDGQTNHMINEYKPINPWEYEFTADVAWQIGKPVFGRNILVAFEYHDGRVSTTDFYYQRVKEVTIGLCVK